ncbi:MAG: orotate phosphoribosyltransferase [Clostridiales Family XIII bacterium]|jgi:orotate phosphoribosyltransferase|nr:orotate phosphoribosyltransferase [Clostridiales Family XIII bacterium]
MNYKDSFIEFMAKSGVLTFGEFVTKSGRHSPYFINTGNYRTGGQIAALGGFYADCIEANMESGNISRDVTVLFGPAYKGIPLAVSAAAALAGRGADINYCFNRKEAKDHGEGGGMVGYNPASGDKVLIIEDVITAGTAVRECLPLFNRIGGVKIEALIVSVDRMEKGAGDRTAIDELFEDYGIRTCPIVTVSDIMSRLHNRPVDGVVYIDDLMKQKMETYMREYCAAP